MKTATAATLAILNSTGDVKILRADLYTFTLRNGTVLRFTDADINLVVSGQLFISGPNIVRSKTKQTIGVNVDTVQVQLFDAGSYLLSGKPIVHQFRNGLFKGATCKIQKLFLLDFADTSPGPVDWFEGLIGAPSCDHMSASFEVRAFTDQLNQQMPRDVYQATCGNSLYDSVCGAVPATFTFTGTATAVVDRKKFTLSGVTQADTYFALGKAWFTSGANVGQPPRTIKKYASGVVEVFQPFPYDVASGDVLVCRAGCDKLPASCGPSKFNRYATGFKAQPFIPVPETAVEGGGVGGTTSTSGSTGTAVVGSAGTAGRRPGTYQQ